MEVRLSKKEKDALKFSLEDFSGDVYVFGSRIDMNKKGGDIDLLLVPQDNENSLELSLKVQSKFFSICEEDIDVAVYDEKNSFFGEALKNAKRLDVKKF